MPSVLKFRRQYQEPVSFLPHTIHLCVSCVQTQGWEKKVGKRAAEANEEYTEVCAETQRRCKKKRAKLT